MHADGLADFGLVGGDHRECQLVLPGIDKLSGIFQIGANGVVTIDVSGAGSGTVLSEGTMVFNDAAFDWDSETQNLNIGDGINDVTFTDNGVITFAGTAYIDSETNDANSEYKSSPRGVN